MHTGMLWFDNSSSTLEIKLLKAKDYYVKKYGRQPDLVLVHPLMFANPEKAKPFEMHGMTVRPYRPVLNGHIWIGIEDKGDAETVTCRA